MRSTGGWLALALLLNTVLALVDALSGPRTTFAGILIVGPLFASARLPAPHTALISACAVVFALALGVPDGYFGTPDHIMRCLIVALGGGFAVLAARMRGQRDAALTRMTEVADVAQRALLRPIPADIGGMVFAYHYQSASREALIGGDFYDTALTPYGLRVIVGDVKGKGMEGVRLATAVLGHFREAAFAEPSLVQLVKRLDAHLADQMGEEDFVTVVVAEFVPGQVRLVNCGHHPPIRVGRGLEALAPPEPTLPLGLQPDPIPYAARLDGHERLLLYTDGLIEARNAHGDMLTLDDEAESVLMRPHLQDALHGLLDLMFRHTGCTLRDDVVLLLGQPAPERNG